MRSRPAPASWAKAASKASKNGFETPLETYQKHSPVAGDTNAEAMMAWRDRARADRRPYPSHDRFHSEPMLVGGERFDRDAGMGRGFLGDDLGDFF